MSEKSMGNGSRCRLTPSRRRTPDCQMARWCLECKVAVANEPVRCIVLWLRMPKWKSSLRYNESGQAQEWWLIMRRRLCF